MKEQKEEEKLVPVIVRIPKYKKDMLEKNENFQVDSEDKYTIVIWVEGDDPDCIDELIGGEIKMNMRLTEEHINLENN